MLNRLVGREEKVTRLLQSISLKKNIYASVRRVSIKIKFQKNVKVRVAKNDVKNLCKLLEQPLNKMYGVLGKFLTPVKQLLWVFFSRRRNLFSTPNVFHVEA